jgi:hypothetical protein
MAEDGQQINGAGQKAENVEQGSVTRGLLTDAAIVAGPSAAVYLNHYLNSRRTRRHLRRRRTEGWARWPHPLRHARRREGGRARQNVRCASDELQAQQPALLPQPQPRPRQGRDRLREAVDGGQAVGRLAIEIRAVGVLPDPAVLRESERLPNLPRGLNAEVIPRRRLARL